MCLNCFYPFDLFVLSFQKVMKVLLVLSICVASLRGMGDMGGTGKGKGEGYGFLSETAEEPKRAEGSKPAEGNGNTDTHEKVTTSTSNIYVH